MHDPDQIPLRVVGRSRDGQHLIVSDPEGQNYVLELTDSVRSVVNAPVLRVTNGGAVEYADENDAPLTPKLIQQRIRAGESVHAIAQSGGLDVAAVERFAGPVLLERQHIAEQAQQTLMRKGDGQTLYALVTDRLLQRGVAPEDIDWDSWKREDGRWTIVATFPGSEGLAQAFWILDNSKRSLQTDNDAARWLTGDDRSPAEKIAVPAAGIIPPSQPSQPRLVPVREPDPTPEPAPAPSSKGRASIPSWDDILFGTRHSDDS